MIPSGVAVRRSAHDSPAWACPKSSSILAIVILIFGANRLPQLGKGLGQSIRNFKGGLRAGEKEEKDA